MKVPRFGFQTQNQASDKNESIIRFFRTEGRRDLAYNMLILFKWYEENDASLRPIFDDFSSHFLFLKQSKPFQSNFLFGETKLMFLLNNFKNF